MEVKMKHFEQLEAFIKENPDDWVDKLKPYMKSITPVENRDWVVLMYNLVDMPKDKKMFDIVCQCRGTVVDKKTGEIICAPFVKFWNYQDKDVAANIDWDSAWTTHKRDGWIFKAFKHDNFVYWMSNGRVVTENDRGAPVDFVPNKPRLNDMSDVLNRALHISGLEECGGHFSKGFFTSDDDWCKRIPNGSTVMFELESPWNVIHTRLVDDAKLWLIGFRMPSGDELTMFEAKDLYKIPFETPKRYDFKDEKSMLEILSDWTVKENGEGVVVCDKDFNRVKVKIDDYIRIKFETKGEEYGDNRLFRYYCLGEVDDLVSANPNVAARVEEIKKNLAEFKEFLSKKILFVEQLKVRYGDKASFFSNIEKDFENGKFLKTLYDKSVDDVYNKYMEDGKKSRTLYKEILHLMNKSMTDGTENHILKIIG